MCVCVYIRVMVYIWWHTYDIYIHWLHIRMYNLNSLSLRFYDKRRIFHLHLTYTVFGLLGPFIPLDFVWNFSVVGWIHRCHPDTLRRVRGQDCLTDKHQNSSLVFLYTWRVFILKSYDCAFFILFSLKRSRRNLVNLIVETTPSNYSDDFVSICLGLPGSLILYPGLDY